MKIALETKTSTGSDEQKILIIGMCDSVHLARWLSQFTDSDLKFRLVPSSPQRRLHPLLRNLIESFENFSLSRASRFLALPLWLLDRFLGDFLRAILIAIEARKFGPTLVHVLEFQNGGYAYLRARQLSPVLRRVPLMLTPYGSDLFWFKDVPGHLKKLRRLLSIADGLSSECRRDEQLAQELGFKGRLLPRIPAFGAVDIPTQVAAPQDRHIIAVKGYQNRWGQALNAIAALESVADLIQNYEIVLFSCNRRTMAAAKKLSAKTGLRVSSFKKNSLSHTEVQGILAESAIFIGLSKSDGISASMIEAMANGAVPLQSDTSCCDEWLEHGKGGYLVKYDDIRGVASLVVEVLAKPDFIAEAAALNRASLKARLDSAKTRLAARQTYDFMF